MTWDLGLGEAPMLGVGWPRKGPTAAGPGVGRLLRRRGAGVCRDPDLHVRAQGASAHL